MENLEGFKQFRLSLNMIQALEKKGFEEPTPIQKKIIPLMLESNGDLVGQAQTGTGKTAAFGIPIIEKIQENIKHVQVLILVPTRELAIQVSEELNSLKGKKRLEIIPVYGGQSIVPQLRRLKHGVDIVVGTPGRVIDHIERKSLNLKDVSYAVLDEADEMLNMGFIDDVEHILASTNQSRSTLLFSATMPKEIIRIAEKYMKGYKKLLSESEKITVDLTDQIFFEVSSADKFEALCRIIDIEDYFYGLIFCRTKVDVDEITGHLKNRGYNCEAIHGEVTQNMRETILKQFKKKQLNILVATDVAARGLDIQNLSHVINYSIPQDPDSYVHRIGRTGRAGKAGTAITFITPEEYRKLMYIKKITKTEIRKKKIPKIHDIIKAKRSRIRKEISNAVQLGINPEFMQLAEELAMENNLQTILASLLQQKYKNELDPDSYSEIKDYYSKNYNEAKDESSNIKGETRLFVARGKKDNMTKRKLVEFIKNKAKISDRQIDDVQVFDTFSFITVPFKEAEIILDCFQRETKGKRSVVTLAKEDKKRKR